MGIVWLRDPVTGLLGRGGGEERSCFARRSCSCNRNSLQCRPYTASPAPGTCGVHRPAGSGGDD